MAGTPPQASVISDSDWNLVSAEKMSLGISTTGKRLETNCSLTFAAPAKIGLIFQADTAVSLVSSPIGSRGIPYGRCLLFAQNRQENANALLKLMNVSKNRSIPAS